MGRPKGPSTRILGTEDRGGSGDKRYRVRYLLDGRESHRGFATAGAASRFVERFARDHAKQTGATVDETIERWLEDRAAQGLSTREYYGRSVRLVLDAVLDSPAGAATGAAMANGYKTTCEGRAGASCRLILSCLRTFGQFLVDEKLAKENPAGGIKPRGVAKKGKAQIETRRELLAFQAETFRRAGEGDRASLGVLLGLHLGMRSAEVRALEPRHIDLDRTIRVPGTKTTAAVRSLRIVSDELWTLVDQAARAGGHLVPFWGSTLIIRVRQLAQAAGVSNHMALTFHSLRGMAASLATEGGAAESAIAAALGHKSYAVTAEHYATPASQEAAAGQRRFQVLKGGR